jgi:hypothetical protein
MGISQQNNLNIDQSNDNSEYRFPFHYDALRLITEAYGMLRAAGGNHSDFEEPTITGEIVRCARRYIEAPQAPEWASRYAVHDDPPENDVTRMGKHRKQVDIILECVQRGKHPRIRFEAKRLKRPGFLAGAYVGGEGLGEFIAGNYGAGDDTAGMLGYIQSDDCNYWAKEISETLEAKKREVGLIEGAHWRRAHFDVDHCYKTRHNRPTVKRELLVYHLLLALHKTA